MKLDSGAIRRPLKPAQLACFVLIWTSIAVFSFDMWRKMRADRMIEIA